MRLIRIHSAIIEVSHSKSDLHSREHSSGGDTEVEVCNQLRCGDLVELFQLLLGKVIRLQDGGNSSCVQHGSRFLLEEKR